MAQSSQLATYRIDAISIVCTSTLLSHMFVKCTSDRHAFTVVFLYHLTVLPMFVRPTLTLPFRNFIFLLNFT